MNKRTDQGSILRWLVLISWVLLVSLLAIWGDLSLCGRLVLPLDDSYIFLQYAHNAANGNLLQYQAGMPVSTGASSLLYQTILIPFALVFTGDALVWVAFLLGVLTLFACGALLWRGFRNILGETTAYAAGLIAVMMGPVVWLSLSGMDGGLFMLCMVLALCGYSAWIRGKSSVLLWLGLALVTLCRSEGIAVWGITVLALAFLHQRGSRLPWHPLMVLAPVLWLAQGLLYSALTGVFVPMSMLSKSPWLRDYTIMDRFSQAASFFFYAIKSVLLGMGAEDAFPSANMVTSAGFLLPPLTLLLAIVGVIRRVYVKNRLHPALLALLWLLALVSATSLFTPYHRHWSRYLIPALVLLAPGMALGLRVLGRMFGAVKNRFSSTVVWGVALAVCLLVGDVLFISIYPRNARDIAAQHVEAAGFLSGRHEIILTHDVGALAYYDAGIIVDMEGLVSPQMAVLSNAGKGALWEELYRQPRGKRPTVFAGYPEVMGLPEAGILDKKIWSVTLPRLSIAGWNPYEIWTLKWVDWESKDFAISNHLLELSGKGSNVEDELDVGYLKSEAEHQMRRELRDPEVGMVTAAQLSYPTGDYVSGSFRDAGRLLVGKTEFALKAQPGYRHQLVLRVNNEFEAEVSINGLNLGKLTGGNALASGEFADISLELPTELDNAGMMNVELDCDDNGARAPKVFHVFLVKQQK